MEAIGAFIFVVLVFFWMIIYSSFSWGFVCFKFWMWFILPIFPMLPTLTFLQCVGLMIFISLFNRNIPDDTIKENKWERVVAIMILPWVVLSMAWFIKILFIS